MRVKVVYNTKVYRVITYMSNISAHRVNKSIALFLIKNWDEN